jgi:hypothetical protein
MARRRLFICVALLGLWGCSDSDPDAQDAGGDDAGMSGTQVLTDKRTLAPTTTPLTEADKRSPLVPDDRESMLEDGYGEWKAAAGEKPVEYVAGDKPPAPGKDAKRLVRFAHLADIQLVDDESPGRVVNLDNAGAFGGAFRPQESELCHMLNAMVGTLNRVHAQTPLSFVLLGGDNADNAQGNEVDWMLHILGGADEVHCDSGEDNDLVPGPNNDGKDPFRAPGLDMPFYWVTGNHDVEVQGTAAVTDDFRNAVVGTMSLPGYQLRDFSQPGGPASNGPVPADPARRFLRRSELMQRVLDHDDGHGLSKTQVDSGKAIYTFDVPNTPLRFLVLDTAAETGASDGVIHQADIDKAIKPAFDEAMSDDKWVIITSHHAVRAMTNGGGFMGQVQNDAVLGPEWVEFLGGYPNLLFSLVAHDHADHVEQQKPATGHAYWELTSGSLADYPHQTRIIEIWDEDNGYVSVRATYVDLDMEDEPVAEAGRHLGVMDYVSGWNTFFAAGKTSERNATVYIEKP